MKIAQTRAEPAHLFEGTPRNRLLTALPPDSFAHLRPHLKHAAFKRGALLQDFDAAQDHVFFIESGLVSLQVHTGRDYPVEVGLIGQGGLIGASAALGNHVSLRAVVEVAGEAVAMAAKPFRAAVIRSPAFLQLLLDDLQAVTMQSAQLVLCNARHETEQRVARWLLQAQDWLATDQLPITHQVIGSNLGMRRASVTEALSRFERAGAVHTERACVTILDRDGLQDLSCDCYHTIRREYDRLLG